MYNTPRRRRKAWQLRGILPVDAPASAVTAGQPGSPSQASKLSSKHSNAAFDRMVRATAAPHAKASVFGRMAGERKERQCLSLSPHRTPAAMLRARLALLLHALMIIPTKEMARRWTRQRLIHLFSPGGSCGRRWAFSPSCRT